LRHGEAGRFVGILPILYWRGFGARGHLKAQFSTSRLRKSGTQEES